jgi:hypothetical protein
MPSYNTVTRDLLLGHSELVAIMLDKHVPFFKRTRVEKNVDPLACSQLPFGVLSIDPALTTAETGLRPFFFQFFDNALHFSGFSSGRFTVAILTLSHRCNKHSRHALRLH